MKRVILLIVILFFVAGASYCDEKTVSNGSQKDASLFPIVQNGKYGFINKTGEIVITPQFDYANGFSEGLAPVNVGGTLVMFDIGSPNYSPMIFKSVSGGKWGVIDKQGNIVIKPQFDGIDGFREGLASINLGATDVSKRNGLLLGGKWGVIDRTGKIVIPTKYNWEILFYQGLASFNVGGKQGWHGIVTGGKWGSIDKTGKTVIEPKFDMLFRFSDGLACVCVDGHFKSIKLSDLEKPVDIYKDGKWGFIDTSGNFVIKPLYQKTHKFSEGLAHIKLKDKYGYIDLKGNYAIPPQYFFANRFSEGLAFVGNENINGFINKDGEFVIKLDKQQISSVFVDGLAKVMEFKDKEVKWGVIDKNGEFVIPLDSRGLIYQKEGIFSVYLGSKIGYMDSSGKYIWKPTE